MTEEEKKQRQRESSLAWYHRNIEVAKKAHKTYYQKSDKNKVLGEAKTRRRKMRKRWLEIIKDKGLDKCSICGYDSSFSAIDLHHINSETKKYAISHLMNRLPTKERIAEFDKCIALCSNCHRELHSFDNYSALAIEGISFIENGDGDTLVVIDDFIVDEKFIPVSLIKSILKIYNLSYRIGREEIIRQAVDGLLPLENKRKGGRFALANPIDEALECAS